MPRVCHLKEGLSQGQAESSHLASLTHLTPHCTHPSSSIHLRCAGSAASENGSHSNTPLPSPRQDGPSQNGQAAESPAAKANGKHPVTEHTDTKTAASQLAAPGTQAQMDAHKALEETVEHLKASTLLSVATLLHVLPTTKRENTKFQKAVSVGLCNGL